MKYLCRAEKITFHGSLSPFSCFITCWVIILLNRWKMMLISFEIMSNLVQISQVKFTDRLFYYTANASALVSTTLHFSNPARLLRFSDRVSNSEQVWSHNQQRLSRESNRWFECMVLLSSNVCTKTSQLHHPIWLS